MFTALAVSELLAAVPLTPAGSCNKAHFGGGGAFRSTGDQLNPGAQEEEECPSSCLRLEPRTRRLWDAEGGPWSIYTPYYSIFLSEV